MLPKIIVAGAYEREELLSSFDLTPSATMGYEGGSAKIDDLRHFINFGVNVSAGSSELSLVIWDADRLSPECQAVLLKPLEESLDNTRLFLIATNENGLLATIVSRCVVIHHQENGIEDNGQWKNVLLCFSRGPSKCLAFADELEKTETESTLEEIILKLKTGLSVEVNKNRLKILSLAIDCIAKLRFTNVNVKLAFGDFLISSWRLIKA